MRCAGNYSRVAGCCRIGTLKSWATGTASLGGFPHQSWCAIGDAGLCRRKKGGSATPEWFSNCQRSSGKTLTPCSTRRPKRRRGKTIHETDGPYHCRPRRALVDAAGLLTPVSTQRSEEHTSELQSH